MAGSTLRITSRRSQLAMVQTHWVRDELARVEQALSAWQAGRQTHIQLWSGVSARGLPDH